MTDRDHDTTYLYTPVHRQDEVPAPAEKKGHLSACSSDGLDWYCAPGCPVLAAAQAGLPEAQPDDWDDDPTAVTRVKEELDGALRKSRETLQNTVMKAHTLSRRLRRPSAVAAAKKLSERPLKDPDKKPA